MRSELAEIRDILAALVNEMAADGSTDSDEVARRFMKENTSLLAAHSNVLIRTSIVKLVNEVSRRKPPSAVTNAQGDLFFGYSGPSVLVKSRSGPGSGRRKVFFNMTISEVDLWLKEHKRKFQSENKDFLAIEAILKHVKPYASPSTTIADAMRIAGAQKKTA